MTSQRMKGVELDVSEFDNDPPLPLDTPAGIMQRISKLNREARSANQPRQCSSTFTSGKRTLNTAFCSLEEGHVGEHRGYRKRWPNKNDPTKSTLQKIQVTVTFDLCFDRDPGGIPRVIEDMGWASFVDAGMPTDLRREAGIVAVVPGTRKLQYKK